MPYPSQFTRDALTQTARSLFEEHGYEAVSMAQIASALNVRASSLYKHVQDKSALLRDVNTLTLQELSETLQAAVEKGATPYEQCLLMGRAYWDYAMAHPGAYELAYMKHYHAALDAEINDRLTRPLQGIFGSVLSPDAAFNALCGAWALLHGFVSLVLGDHFRLVSSVDYEPAFRAYLAGWGITP